MKNRIKELREKLGITQEQLGQLVGTSRQAINALETEKNEPSIWLAYDIAQVFHDRDKLISRPKELYDGALPSGNSVAAYVLEKLYHLTGKIKWQNVLEKQISFLTQEVKKSPANYCFSLLAFQGILYPSTEIVCVSAEDSILKEIQDLQKIRTPEMSVLLKTPLNEKALSDAAPFTADYPIPPAGSNYYICRNGACMKPVEGIEELKKALQSL